MARSKEFRKADYFATPNCFGKDCVDKKGKWKAHFGNDNPLTLELGCGRADLSLAFAARYPERNFLGIDLKPARLWKPAKRMQEEGVKNIAFIYMHLMEIGGFFAENEADEIWITFPDPFPKLRHAKHRMINPPFLALYRNILKKGGKIHFKTDNLDLFHYALEIFVREKNITLLEISFDLHNDAINNEEIGTKTEYERKFMAEGIPIKYVCFSFNDK